MASETPTYEAFIIETTPPEAGVDAQLVRSVLFVPTGRTSNDTETERGAVAEEEGEAAEPAADKVGEAEGRMGEEGSDRSRAFPPSRQT